VGLGWADKASWARIEKWAGASEERWATIGGPRLGPKCELGQAAAKNKRADKVG
jgi:hypothetical protein